jgi:hypothetical protein
VVAPPDLIIFDTLTGPALGAAGTVPIGKARYRDITGVQNITCEVHHVDLPNFTVCTLSLNGTPLMTTPLFAGVAIFRGLSTVFGDAVPVCHPGDVVTITAAGFGPIMTGAFSTPLRSSRSPWSIWGSG